jgi:hypothetical protein
MHAANTSNIMPHHSSMLFLCGFPSSGTDLLKNLLNAHPDIEIGGEFPLLPSLARRFGPNVSADTASALVAALVGCDIYRNLQQHRLPATVEFPTSLATIYRHLLGVGDVRWAGNKTPQNSENVARLEHLFPGSRYVLIVRDIRDVALSWENKWGKDALLCAHKWNDRMTRALRMLEDLASGRYFIVHYESVLEDHVKVAGDICGFLQIPYNDRMSNYHEYVHHTVPGKLNYGKPVIKDNKGKWNEGFSDSRIERLEAISFDAMKRFGYTPSLASYSTPITSREVLLGRCRDLVAMLTVGNRAYSKRLHMYVPRLIGREFAKRFGRYHVNRRPR